MAKNRISMPADSVRRLHRSRSRLGRQNRGAVQGRGHQVRQAGIPVGGGFRPRHRKRSRRRLHRCCSIGEPSHHRRRDRGHARRRPDQRNLPCDRDGCEPADIAQDHSSASDTRESIGMAAEVFEGHCTDLPPQRRSSGTYRLPRRRKQCRSQNSCAAEEAILQGPLCPGSRGHCARRARRLVVSEFAKNDWIKAMGDGFCQVDQDGHRAGHLLHGRVGHCPHFRSQESRARRHQGAGHFEVVSTSRWRLA